MWDAMMLLGIGSLFAGLLIGYLLGVHTSTKNMDAALGKASTRLRRMPNGDLVLAARDGERVAL